jgi:hypothetical protein
MKKKNPYHLSEEFLQILDYIYGDLPSVKDGVFEQYLCQNPSAQELAENLLILALSSDCSKEELKKQFGDSKRRLADRLNLNC